MVSRPYFQGQSSYFFITNTRQQWIISKQKSVLPRSAAVSVAIALVVVVSRVILVLVAVVLVVLVFTAVILCIWVT